MVDGSTKVQPAIHRMVGASAKGRPATHRMVGAPATVPARSHRMVGASMKLRPATYRTDSGGKRVADAPTVWLAASGDARVEPLQENSSAAGR